MKEKKMVKVSPEIHKTLRILAAESGKTIEKTLEDIIFKSVVGPKEE